MNIYAQNETGYELIRTTTRKILEEQNYFEVLRVICEEACRVLGADRSMIVRVHEEEFPRREVVCAYKLPEKLLESLQARRSPSIVVDILRKRKLTVIPDLCNDKRVFDLELVRQMGHRTVCIIPLIVNGEAFGCLNLYHLKPREYGKEDLSLAEAIGDLASIAIEKAQLVKSLQFRLEEQSSLQRALHQVVSGHGVDEIIQAVLVESERVMETDRCGVMLPNRSSGEPRLFVSHGLSSEFVDRLAVLPTPFPLAESFLSDPTFNHPVVIPDATQEPMTGSIQKDEGHRTMAVFPLRVESSNIGALFFYWTSPRQIDEQKLALGQAFANQVAVVIEKARITQEDQDRAARLEVVDRIAKAVGATLEPEELFQVIVREIRRAVPCERCLLSTLGQEIRHDWYAESDVDGVPPNSKTISEASCWVQEVYREKKVVRINDLREVDSRRARQLLEVGFQSVLSVPIVQDGRCIAHLSLTGTKLGAFTEEQEKFLASISDHLGSAIQNATLYTSAKERAQRLAVLNDLSRQIAQNLELEEVLRSIAQAATELTQGDKCRLFLYDETQEHYYLCASFGQIPDEGAKTFKSGEGLIGTVAETGKPHIIKDVLEDSRWVNVNWARKNGLHAYVAVPIQLEGKTALVINCFSKNIDYFDQDDLDLLEAFASQAAIAVDKSRLIKEIRDHASKQEITARIASTVGSTLEPDELFKIIFEEIRRLVTNEHCVIASVWGEGRRHVYWHIDSQVDTNPWASNAKGVSEWFYANVYEPKRVWNVPDLDQGSYPWTEQLRKAGFRSTLIIPIVEVDRCISHLALSSTRIGAFSKNDEEILSSIAEHLGPAIRNAVLYKSAETRAERLSTLHSLNQKITENLDPSDVLSSVADSAMNLIGADHARIFLFDEVSSTLVLRASVGKMKASDTEEEFFLPGQGLTGTVYQKGESIISPDIQDNPLFSDTGWVKKHDLHAYIGQPIRKGEKSLGVIICLSRHEGFFDEEDLDLLEGLASQAAVAIINAGLYEESEEKGKRLATLVEIAQRLTRGLSLSEVLDSIAEVTAMLFEGESGFRMREGDELVLVAATAGTAEWLNKRVPIEGSIAGHVLTTGEPFVSLDMEYRPSVLRAHDGARPRQESSAILCVPVKVGERSIGALHVRRKRGQVFNEEEIRIATSLADQIAIAVENARLHEEAQRSQTFFRSVVEDNVDAIVISNKDRRVIQWNAGAEKLYGYSEEEALGQDISALIPDEKIHLLVDRTKAIFEEGRSFFFETDRIRKDGSRVPVSISISPVKDEDGKTIAACTIHKDLTERKRAEEAIRQSEERYRDLIEFAADAIFVYGLDARFLDVNHRACDSLGYKREELLSMSVFDVSATFEQERFEERWKQMLEKEQITFEAVHRRKDGSTFPVEVCSGKINSNGRQMTISLVRDITERKKSEQKLLRALEEANAASQAKSDFLSTMSHELRSPLNAVIGFSDLLLRDSKEEITQQLVPKIRDSGRYLLSMIEEMLDLDRIEAGKVVLDLQLASINDLVSGVVSAWHPRLPDRFSMSLDLDFDCGVLSCDTTRISQIINNLIDNAVKYSPDGGSIHVFTKAFPDEVWIGVSDEGLGMSTDVQEVIFERFHQLESGYKRRAGGLGIGLALSRELMKMHGGRIWVESSEGKGSVFRCALPRIQQDVSQGSPPEKGGEERHVSEEPWRGRKVLVVDDMEYYLEYMRHLMASAERVESVFNGREAIEAVQNTRPDIILMDLRMPVMDGFEAIKRLKSDPSTREIPIMAVSAQAMEVDRLRSMEAGADGFLTKPVDLELFRSEFERILGVGVR